MDKDEGENGRLLGPWSVAMLERSQLCPYYVVRQIGISHWEQMRDDFGAAARFESYSEAEAAADAANTNEPNVEVEALAAGKSPRTTGEAWSTRHGTFGQEQGKML